MSIGEATASVIPFPLERRISIPLDLQTSTRLRLYEARGLRSHIGRFREANEILGCEGGDRTICCRDLDGRYEQVTATAGEMCATCAAELANRLERLIESSENACAGAVARRYAAEVHRVATILADARDVGDYDLARIPLQPAESTIDTSGLLRAVR